MDNSVGDLDELLERVVHYVAQSRIYQLNEVNVPDIHLALLYLQKRALLVTPEMKDMYQNGFNDGYCATIDDAMRVLGHAFNITIEKVADPSVDTPGYTGA